MSKCSHKLKSDDARSEIQIEHKWSFRSNSVNVDTASLRETLYMQREVLSEGKLADVNEESGCEERDEDVPEEVMLAVQSPLKELSQIFHYIESTENKVLEADPNFERSMTIDKGIKKKNACSIA